MATKANTMSDTSRVSHDNAVFEEPNGEGLGKPSPADAIPQPADPHFTGEDAYPDDEDIDETLAGGLRDKAGPPDA